MYSRLVFYVVNVLLKAHVICSVKFAAPFRIHRYSLTLWLRVVCVYFLAISIEMFDLNQSESIGITITKDFLYEPVIIKVELMRFIL